MRGLVYWGISNPMPNTRLERHGGNPNAIPADAPADLYSNSTVALDPETGELVWYYQHLPGDDWDMDINQEKMLIRSVIDPDPQYVKWINPSIEKGVERDVVITVGEGGGVWVNDRDTGEFLWAMPFPYDTPNFILSDINVNTGATRINMDIVFEEPGDLVFWGDIAQVLHAFDAESGEALWESEPLGAPIQTSTITYAVDGKQYVAVVNSNALIPPSRMASIGGATLPPHEGNSINVFALPD